MIHNMYWFAKTDVSADLEQNSVANIFSTQLNIWKYKLEWHEYTTD